MCQVGGVAGAGVVKKSSGTGSKRLKKQWLQWFPFRLQLRNTILKSGIFTMLSVTSVFRHYNPCQFLTASSLLVTPNWPILQMKEFKKFLILYHTIPYSQNQIMSPCHRFSPTLLGFDCTIAYPLPPPPAQMCNVHANWSEKNQE